jgi:cyclopropane fatty-acyl-phospholipid synthase-like methyltransferase
LSQLVQGKSLLHIGIGNGQMFSELREQLSSYVDLTISIPEIRQFHSRFAFEHKAVVVLANKHDPRVYPKIRGNFDIIVDVNLKSYTCCEEHFQSLMRFYSERLCAGGQIITDETGIRHSWRAAAPKLRTPRA